MALSPFWSLERFNLVSFYRSDYLGDAGQDLSDAVKNRIKEHTGDVIQGPNLPVNPFAISGLLF